MVLTHNNLIALGTLLGYSNFKGGLCRGFSGMLAQALMAHDTKSFYARLRLILSYQGRFDELTRKIQAAKEKSMEREPLSEEEKALLGILAFYDGTTLYLAPNEHNDVFDHAYTSQHDIEKIFHVTTPEILKPTSLTTLLKKDHAFSNKAGLISYLNNLKTILKKDTPVILGSDNHSVFLSYDPETDLWTYCDSNNLAKLDSEFVEPSTAALAGSIFKSFKDQDTTLFTTTVLATNCSAEEREQFQAFDEHHPITAEIAQLANRRDTNLLHLLCKNGKDVSVLLQNGMGGKVNMLNEEGYTPLVNAVFSGDVWTVDTLLKVDGIDVNHSCQGATPLYSAVSCGYADIVGTLLNKEGINIYKPYKRFTPLDLAIDKGHFLIVELLLKKMVENAGIPLTIQAKIQPFLEKEITKIQPDFSSSYSPEEIDAHKETLLTQVTTRIQSLAYQTLSAQQKAILMDIATAKKQEINQAAAMWHLLAAVRNGDLDINEVNPEGFTPLGLAVDSGAHQIIDTLLTLKDIHVNQTSHGKTPLESAIKKGFFSIVERLLRRMGDAVIIPPDIQLEIGDLLQKEMSEITIDFGYKNNRKQIQTHQDSLLNKLKTIVDSKAFNTLNEELKIKLLERAAKTKQAINTDAANHFTTLVYRICAIEPIGTLNDLLAQENQETITDLLKITIMARLKKEIAKIKIKCNGRSAEQIESLKHTLLINLTVLSTSQAFRVLNEQQRTDLSALIATKKQQISQTADEYIARLQILSTMKFDEHLKVFANNATEMARKAALNSNYTKAAGDALKFCTDLTSAKKEFLQSNQSTALSMGTLRESCQRAVDKARPTLETHREWRGAFKKFIIDALSVLTIGLVNLSLFAKTNLAKKLDQFEQDFSNNSLSSIDQAS